MIQMHTLIAADKEGELTVQSNVNTAKAGSYYVDYIVNAGAISGKSRLVVVVQNRKRERG